MNRLILWMIQHVKQSKGYTAKLFVFTQRDIVLFFSVGYRQNQKQSRMTKQSSILGCCTLEEK